METLPIEKGYFILNKYSSRPAIYCIIRKGSLEENEAFPLNGNAKHYLIRRVLTFGSVSDKSEQFWTTDRAILACEDVAFLKAKGEE